MTAPLVGYDERELCLSVDDSATIKLPSIPDFPPYEFLAVEVFLDTMERRLARSPPPDSMKSRVVVTRITPFRSTDMVKRPQCQASHLAPRLEHINPGLFDWHADRALFLGSSDLLRISPTATHTEAPLESLSDDDDYNETGKVIHLLRGVVIYRSLLRESGTKFEYRSLKK